MVEQVFHDFAKFRFLKRKDMHSSIMYTFRTKKSQHGFIASSVLNHCFLECKKKHLDLDEFFSKNTPTPQMVEQIANPRCNHGLRLNTKFFLERHIGLVTSDPKLKQKKQHDLSVGTSKYSKCVKHHNLNI